MPRVSKSVSSKSESKSVELGKKYQKKTQYEHITDRPDTYIGSVSIEKDLQYILCNDGLENMSIEQKEIENVQGLYKIFDEIIVNAIDNKNRIDNLIEAGNKSLKPMKTIEVNFSKFKIPEYEEPVWGIQVKNDGEGIDVEIHPTEKIWIPDMIFGHLLTSSNYDDTEKKITGGKNGFGAKLTNIYSSYFKVETVDRHRKRYYCCEYFDRMLKKKEEPIIKEKYNKSPFTSITFIPYYKAFGLTNLTDDIMNLFKKRVYDMVYCGFGKLKVILNGKELFQGSKNPQADYIKLYNIKDVPIYECKPHKRWLISACVSEDFYFKQVSFVNGINTCRGGKHVNYITKQICKGLINEIKRKEKITVNEKFIKDNLMIFVNAIIENPDFDGQTKETLKTNEAKFGSSFNLPKDFIDKLASKECGLIQRALALNQFKDSKLLQQTDGKKARKLIIPKLDDAEYAGTKNSLSCTLILTEGDSAKATAMDGVSVIKDGGKYYGIFPLKGKLLNTRDRSVRDIASNSEIANIKQIVGLQENMDYSKDNNFKKLRYGRVMIMTDQDVDGSHIKGLLINYFHHNFPELLKDRNFIISLATPVVKVWKKTDKKSKKVLNFYDLPTYNNWRLNNNDGKGYEIKYYKGLGTSTKDEAKDYFLNPKIIEFEWDDNANDSIDKVFSKKRANDRKDWLNSFNNETLKLDGSKVSYTKFIDDEFRHFSMYDVHRSIPNLMDGLKPGQRKIIYSCFKRNLKNEIKVARLAGYVSEHSAYHHGEKSLEDTIIGMAQNYPGSNNINLLYPKGQFGTRLTGGKDAASARYIFTYLSNITFSLFNKNDMPLYHYLTDDGQSIEPVCYAPIIPLVLINGTDGIGTGWNSKVPKFNPEDIVYNLKQKLLGTNKSKKLTPWFHGFKGKVIELADNKWLTKGCYEQIDSNTVRVTELPVDVWINDFKEHLNDLINAKESKTKDRILRDYSAQPGTINVDITLKLEPGILDNMLYSIDKDGISEFERKFKLASKLSCSSNTLNLFDYDNNLRHFKTIDEIFNVYFDKRLELYKLRKDYLIKEMEYNFNLISFKMMFILSFINDTLQLKNKSQENIYKQLMNLKIPRMYNNNMFVFPDNKLYNDADYNYLLNMRISSLTKEKIDELQKEKDNMEIEYNTLKSKTHQQLWIEDLDELMQKYTKHVKDFFDQNSELNPNDYKKKPKTNIKFKLNKLN